MSNAKVSFSALGRRATAPAITRLMTAALENPGILSLAAGFTDNASLPSEAVRSLSVQLLEAGRPKDLLQYGTNQGRSGLRELLAQRVAALDGRANYDASQVLVTNGSQQALYLAMQVLADPGDIVLVDRPSYFVFLEMLKGLGIEAVSMPTQDDGSLDVPGVGRLLADLSGRGLRSRVKAVYFISYFSNPSSRSLSIDEKKGLAQVLMQEGFVLPILEDAAYRELYFDRPDPATSVLAAPEWRDFPRLYLGTLTKPFATGLKVGYGLCTDSEWLGRMLNVKGHQDFGTAHWNQSLLEEALRSGAYEAQTSLLRRVYQEKGQALVAALEQVELRQRGFTWEKPRGGLYVWLRGPATMDTSFEGPFFATAAKAGVLYVPGDLCFGDNAPRNFMRLSFGVLAPERLGEATRRLSGALREAGL